MSTPRSMAARAPALFDGCAKTSAPRRWAASVAARTISTGMTTMASGRAHEPVKSLTTSTPRSSAVVTSAVASTGLASSGRRAGAM
jgi:hypothetical protein